MLLQIKVLLLLIEIKYTLSEVTTLDANLFELTTAARLPYTTVSPDACWDYCSSAEDQCNLPDVFDCRKYVQCIRQRGSDGSRWVAVSMWCGFGTFWDQQKYACEYSLRVSCKNDPCLSPTLKTYKHELSCRTFWTCRDRKSRPSCCSRGKSYNMTSGKCEADDSCLMPCPSIVGNDMSVTTTIKPECPLEAVGKNGKAFRFIGHFAELKCPFGTKFSRPACACMRGIFEKASCESEISIDFSSDRVQDQSGRNIYIDVNNVKNINGAGLFKGESSLSILRYSHTSLGNTVYFKVKFRDSEQGPPRQVVISNCRTATSAGRSASVSIELDKPNLQVNLIAANRAKQVNISLPYQKNAWNTVEYLFDGDRLRGTLLSSNKATEDGSNRINNAVTLKGTLKIGIEPLRIGNCNLGDGFNGQIAEISYFKCLPKTATV